MMMQSNFAQSWATKQNSFILIGDNRATVCACDIAQFSEDYYIDKVTIL